MECPRGIEPPTFSFVAEPGKVGQVPRNPSESPVKASSEALKKSQNPDENFVAIPDEAENPRDLQVTPSTESEDKPPSASSEDKSQSKPCSDGDQGGQPMDPP